MPAVRQVSNFFSDDFVTSILLGAFAASRPFHVLVLEWQITLDVRVQDHVAFLKTFLPLLHIFGMGKTRYCKFRVQIEHVEY